MSKNGVTARVTPFGVNETAYSHTAGRKIQELFTPPPLFFTAKCGRIERRFHERGKTMGCCVIFCAGEFDVPARPLEKDDYIIAADGGLKHTRKLGIEPNETIGDFDSLGFTPPGAEIFPVEKDDTDAMLAVRRGLELGLDHTVANFQTLQFLADRGAVGYLVGNRSIVTVVKNGSIAFPAGLRGNLSVFCMGADARGVTERGLYYTLEDGVLTSGFPLGVSNHFTGEPVHISVRDGSLLVIWDKTAGFPVTEQ